MRRLGAACLFVMAAALSAPASAQGRPDTETCVAAFDRGQRAQSDRMLRRAQAELIVCSQESCPAVLRADCAGVLAEVRRAVPSLVFAADDGAGHELTDVKVFVGDELVAPKLDGRAVTVDPGTFRLRFEREGRAPVVASHTIREGEKSRVIRVSLPTLGGSDPRGLPGASRSRTTLGWALPGSLAAAGLAGLGVALVARLRFDARVDSLRESCAPDCTQEQRSDLSGTLVTSNVALGVGIGALALTAVTWLLTAPSPRPANARGVVAAAAQALAPRGLAW